MNILAIGAHQDEVETQAGGTLAKYSKAGQCGVKYAEAFSSDNSPDRIRPYRILP